MAKTHHIVGEFLNIPKKAVTKSGENSTQGSREATPKREKVVNGEAKKVGNYWARIKWKKDKNLGWVRLNPEPAEEEVFMQGMDWGVDEEMVARLAKGGWMEERRKYLTGDVE